MCSRLSVFLKVRKGAKIRNQYNQVPHLAQDTTWESDTQLNIKNKSQDLNHRLGSNCIVLLLFFTYPLTEASSLSISGNHGLSSLAKTKVISVLKSTKRSNLRS